MLHLALLLSLAALAEAAPAQQIPRWHRFEASLQSDKDYKQPLHEAQVVVALTAPSGAKHTVDAFWDGGRTFRFRFSPDEIGTWKWETAGNDKTDTGLHGQTGSFECVAATARHALAQHGPLRVSEDRYHLSHADGTPFFWMADTAWAAPMMSSEKDWLTFVRDRQAKRFNVVQAITTQNIAAAADATGRQAFYVDGDKLGLEPAFWRRLDGKFDVANDEGLVMSPSFSWAARWHGAGRMLDPGGGVLSDDQLVTLLRYALARYGAHHVVWLFGGDFDYTPEAERWRAIGRRVFGDKPRHLVTMHPAPRKLHHADFKGEPWLGFLGYQSSHSNDERTHRWMVEGEPATAWKLEPRYPIINIEPNYEAHRDGKTQQPITAFDIRRAAYWSVLVSPTAGVTYGAHGIWSWELTRNLPMSHPTTGEARPWSEALELPGSTHMKVLVDVFSAQHRPWWKLRPVPALVVNQPGKAHVGRFIAASRTEDGNLMVVYVPGGPALLDLSKVDPAAKAVWIDPTNGHEVPAALQLGGLATATPPAKNAAGDTDYVLVISRSTGP